MLKRFSIFLFAVSALVLSSSGCSQEKLGPDPEPFPGQDSILVILQGAESIDFSSKAEDEQFQLSVNSVSDWHARTDADWLILEKHDDGLVVKAERNRTLEMRQAEITVTDGVSSVRFDATQAAGHVAIYHVDGTVYTGVQGIPARAVSENGRYVLGYSSSGSWVCDLWNLENVDASNTIGVADVVMYPNVIVPSAYSVSNKGVPVANGCTADGNTEVTYEGVNSFYTSYIIENGVVSVLPAPSETEPVVGTLLPHGGSMAFWISDDGKYIAGRHQLPRGQVFECGWTYNETTGRYDYAVCGKEHIVLDEDEYAVQAFWVDCMSQNGKYVGGRTYGAADGSYTAPYFHDVETGEYVILDSFVGESMSMVTNDGWGAIAGTLGSTRFVDLNGDRTSAISINDWLQQQFNMTDDQVAELGSTGGLMRARCINPDKTTACFAYYPDNNVQAPQWSDIITIE